MAHSKVSMLAQMKLQGGQIVAYLLREDVAIKPDHLAIPKGCEVLRADFIRPGFYWVDEIFNTEYAAVLKFRRQQPEEIWERYKKWGGFEENREVKLLGEKTNALRAKIISRTRPNFFKKTKRGKLLKAKKTGGIPTAKSS